MAQSELQAAQIQVIREPGRTRFIIPHWWATERQKRKVQWRIIGIAICLILLGVASVSLGVLFGIAREVVRRWPPSTEIALVFLSLEIGLALFYFAGLSFSLFLANALFGDQLTVISVQNATFQKTSRLGFLRWTRQWPVGHVNNVRISRNAPARGRSFATLQGDPVGVLYLQVGSRAVRVADRRPLPVIRELAVALATALNDARRVLPEAAAEYLQPLPFVDCSDPAALEADLLEMPMDAQLRIERLPGSLWILVPSPPRNFRNLARSGRIRMAAVMLPLGLVIWAAVNWPPAWLHNGADAIRKAQAFAIVLGVLGILFAVSGLRRFKKQLSISVNADGLTLREELGKRIRSHTWRRCNIAAINVALFQGNPYLFSTALQLVGTDGAKVLLIMGRLEHLRYVATILRNELGCAAKPTLANPKQQPETENTP